MPKVTIIVPNYNHASYLNQRIDSILNQTYQDFELILLDDCSTDNSREILNSYKNHPKVTHLIFNDENSGSTFKQWTKGVELAQGDYIWIAESDDWAEAEFLDTLMHEFEQRPYLGLAYTNSKLVDGDGNLTYENNSNNSNERIEYNYKTFINNVLSIYNPIWNASSMMFKKSLYPNPTQQQLYAEMCYCGDWFFYVLIAEKGIEILEVKQTLNYFRVHENNVSTNAMATGMTFLEGLDIYMYLKQKLSLHEQFTASIIWAKNYCKFKRKQHYSDRTQQQIVAKMKQDHILIWGFYHIFNLYYKLKFR